MAAANGTAQQPQVPAWKRLGLKLKYAKDTADPPPTQGHSDPAATEETQKPAPISQQSAEDEPPSKRRKTSPPADFDSDSNSKALASGSSEQAGAIAEVESTAAKPSVETESILDSNRSDLSKPAEKRSETLKRRKSVSFTGETKKNDGNSAQASSDPAGSSGSANNTEDRISNTSSGASPLEDLKLKEAKPSTDGQFPKKEKAESKSKKQKKAEKKATPTGTPEYVRYLELFHHDQASWKFNKNHQNALLNNLFNVRIVSASLTPAIAAYIEGLKGAGPRQRVTENATTILRKFAEKDGSLDEIDAMNTESARRKAYIEAGRREIEKWESAGMPRTEYDENELADMENEMEQGRRAEAVLLALAKSEAELQAASSSAASVQAASADGRDVSSTSAALPANTLQPKTTSRKKRKKRTDVSSDSSSSDSSSDSDSDTSPPAPTEGPKTVKEALRPTPAPAPKPQPKHSPPAKRTPAYQHGDPNIAYRPQNPSQLMNMSAKPTKTKFFDDELLDQAFPAKKTYNERAPKRKREDGKGGGKKGRRGYAYQHGNVQDESGSESE